MNIVTHNVHAEGGRSEKHGALGSPDYEGMRPAMTRTFNESWNQLSAFSFLISTQERNPQRVAGEGPR